MSDSDFLAAFEKARLDPARFGHEDHVRAAYLMLGRWPLSAALGRYAAALRRLVAKAGRPEKYHETITVAYMLAIADRMARSGAPDWHRFREENPDLLRRSWLMRLYAEDELADPQARERFRLPARLFGDAPADPV